MLELSEDCCESMKVIVIEVNIFLMTIYTEKIEHFCAAETRTAFETCLFLETDFFLDD
jgi:hypothetical protein